VSDSFGTFAAIPVPVGFSLQNTSLADGAIHHQQPASSSKNRHRRAGKNITRLSRRRGEAHDGHESWKRGSGPREN